MRWLGLLALAFYAIHCGLHIRAGHAEDVLWACHVAALVIGVGLLAGWPTWVAVGVTWLAVGVPLWLLDVATGGEFNPTSVLTHVGGLAVGLVGLWQLAMPAQVWWKALLALAALQQLCRWVTPPDANVNVAFSVYPWMKAYFSSYLAYLAAMLLLFGLLFLGTELVLRKLLPGG
jgi:hypothetical protein